MSSTLLIDNHDSFTYNLYALIAQVDGTPPVVVRNDETSWEALSTRRFERIVISPGPGTPLRPRDLGLSADVIRASSLPTLGICLGHQAIAHFCGARVGLATEAIHGRVCTIHHDGEDLFAGLPSPFKAVRYHSLAVTDLPPELQALAWSEDGTLMALRHRTRPLWGVQFHPESICSEFGQELLKRFFELSRSRVPGAVARTTTHTSLPPVAAQPYRQKVFAFALPLDFQAADVFQQLYRDSRTAFWLDSSMTGGELGGQFSYMGDASGPRAEIVRFDATSHTLEIRRGNVTTHLQDSIFDYLDREMRRRRIEPPVEPVGFTCGYVGYFGYEAPGVTSCPRMWRPGQTVLQSDSLVRGNDDTSPGQLKATADACWIFADRMIAIDHGAQRAWLMCVDDCTGLSAENRAWIEATTIALTKAEHRTPAAPAELPECTLQWLHSGPRYRHLIQRAQHLIRMGETYEACLTNQLVGSCDVDPMDVYLALREINPAPYSAFFRSDDLAIACSSPELFLEVDAVGRVRSKPIKGTARRSPNAIEDQRRARSLGASTKDRAENLMIVDLLRNDLNRVCEPGSVTVPQLFAVESYASAHQMVSTVAGHLRAGTSIMDCVRSAFPGGSMTGAPKVRTLQILRELENAPRGPYSGSLGYLSTNGTAKLNILIRTLVKQGNRISMGAGGAIVALSRPDDEIGEVDTKIAPLLKALERCARVRWEPLGARAKDADRRVRSGVTAI